MARPLAEMLKTASPLILDGATGSELTRRGVDTDLPLWSANALITNPSAVLQMHRDYIVAGADIITTNTFRTTRRTCLHANLPDRSEELTALAINLAQNARAEFPSHKVLIAGSIAPLEDCYRPELVPPDAELRVEHAELARRLADNGVDFIILETMNTIREAYAACAAAKATGKEVIVSFICNNRGTILGGDSLSDAVTALADLRPDGFSLNCVSARHMAAPLKELRSLTDLPIAVYANVGHPGAQEPGEGFRREVGEEEYAACATEWLRLGASIIGGCCGTTPAYIAKLAEILP